MKQSVWRTKRKGKNEHTENAVISHFNFITEPPHTEKEPHTEKIRQDYQGQGIE